MHIYSQSDFLFYWLESLFLMPNGLWCCCYLIYYSSVGISEHHLMFKKDVSAFPSLHNCLTFGTQELFSTFHSVKKKLLWYDTIKMESATKTLLCFFRSSLALIQNTESVSFAYGRIHSVRKILKDLKIFNLHDLYDWEQEIWGNLGEIALLFFRSLHPEPKPFGKYI